MFGPTRYLDWARRFYGQIRFDLASSGTPAVRLAEIGVPAAEALDDPTGWSRLRVALARHNDVPEGEVAAALGTTHALWLAYSALVSAGDEVLVETPGYEPVRRIPEGLGVRVRTFERPAAQRFALDPERVAAAMTPATRVVALTQLHNPGGVRATDAELRAVADVAARTGATVLIDEVYAPFDALVGADGVFHGSARKLAPNVVAVGSLTKCYGVGAHRIGWVLGPRELVARADDAITASAGMLPLSHAHQALHVLDQVGTLAERARHALAGKRALAEAWVAAKGLPWSAPDAGLFGFVRTPDSGDLTARLEAGAREREVLVAPGAFFGEPEGFRLAWSAPPAVFEEGLSRLNAIV